MSDTLLVSRANDVSVQCNDVPKHVPRVRVQFSFGRKSDPEGVARSQVLLSTKHVFGRNPHLPPQQILDFVATTRELGARDRQFESQMASAELPPVEVQR